MRFAALPLLLVLAVPAAAQFDVAVSIDREAQAFQVRERFANPGGEDLEFWIARWTPGAYHPADFGRFCRDFAVVDGDGEALDFERVDENHLRIHAGGAREIEVRYSGDSISSGTVSHGTVIDVESNRVREDYAFLNPVSLIGFVPGRLDEAYRVRFELPAEWSVATVLERGEGGVYRAPSYRRLEDSPFLFGADQRTVSTEAGGKPLEVTTQGLSPAAADEIVLGCRAIVDAASDLMGGLPYDRYEFLLSYTSAGGGSGLEHSDSTLILMSQGLPLEAQWGIIAHEFFHLWCAERVHVEGIREADYRRVFRSQTLWVNESVTEYLSRKVLLRAGYLDPEGFFETFRQPLRMIEHARDFPSATRASELASTWESAQDLAVWSLRMYMLEPLTMLALDLEMRRVSGGEKGLVDFVRTAMKEFDARGKGFPEDGVEALLERVAGGDLSGIYGKSIAGSEPPDLASALDWIGYELREDRFVPVEDPTDAQRAAREIFFED